MAKKSRGSKKMPLYSVVFSSEKGKKKYNKGPSLGMWASDSNKVLANGSVKEDRLEDLISFLRKEDKKDHPIYIALFKNKKKREEDDDDLDDDDDDPNDDDDDDGDDDGDDDDD